MSLLELSNLKKRFPVRRGILRRVKGWIHAVDGVSLKMQPGETLGLVGESGCGKTTLGRMVLGLIRADEGRVSFLGRALSDWMQTRRLELRRKMQIIFQDPLDSLDPRFTIEQIVAEPLRATKSCSSSDVSNRVREVLQEVQLSDKILGVYPHELSGGQRQRVGIARAMAVSPDLIVCDEPVSSLDLSIQAQVLQLLHTLQRQHRMGYLFISHDLGVVEAISQRIAVMYLGTIVEAGPTSDVMGSPYHPYTEALLAAIPHPDPEKTQAVRPLGGEPPSASQIPSGCRFRTRCPIAKDICGKDEPPLVEKAPGRFAACHFRP